jgi:hypothetical protein
MDPSVACCKWNCTCAEWPLMLCRQRNSLGHSMIGCHEMPLLQRTLGHHCHLTKHIWTATNSFFHPLYLHFRTGFNTVKLQQIVSFLFPLLTKNTSTAGFLQYLQIFPGSRNKWQINLLGLSQIFALATVRPHACVPNCLFT